MPTDQLLIGSAVVVGTVLFHVAALMVMAAVLKRIAGRLGPRNSARRSLGLLVSAVLGILAVHTIEAWAWAGLYLALGEFETLERALYFSATTATTLGYGDLTLSPRWQLLGTFEAMGGLLLFGVSTAFLIAMMQRLFGSDEAGRSQG